MQLIRKNIDRIIIFFVLVLLISDFATSFVYKQTNPTFYRYSGAFKLIFEVFMLVNIVLNLNFKKFNKIHKLLVFVTLSFITSQLIIYNEDYNIIDQIIRGNIYYFNRYMYILIFILFINVYPIKTETYKRVYTIFENILFLNCLLIIIAIILDIEFLKSYERSQRFGYVGLFSKPEEASFLYIIAIIYNYYSWINKKEKLFLFKLICFIIFTLLLGQKKIFLFLALLISVYLFFEVKYKKLYRVLLPLVFIIIYVFRVKTTEFLISNSIFWKKIYIEKGFLSTITSMRSSLLEDAYVLINEKWSILNYFLGGINFIKYKIEFELFDLYIFMGVIGVFFYFYLIKEYFLKNADELKIKLVVITFITSFFSGGLMLSVTAMILLYIVINKVMIQKT